MIDNFFLKNYNRGMVETFQLPMATDDGIRMRQISLYLPKGAQACPVLYLSDGQTAFSTSPAPFGGRLALDTFLQEYEIPLIVAAVDCDERARLDEYSPFAFCVQGIASAGEAGKYLDWLTGTLKPYVDAHYPTRPAREHTFVMGTSMGGLLAMGAIWRYGAIFSRAVAMSASVWVDPAASARLVATLPPDVRLYFDYGMGEFSRRSPARRSALEGVRAALAQRGGQDVFSLIAGARHNEAAWRSRLPAAMRFLGFHLHDGMEHEV